MNNTTKILTVAAIAIFAGTAAYAKPHHHDHDRHNGVRLATDIVRLVGASLDIVTPRPVIVTQPAVIAPPPVVVPPRPHYYYRPAPPPPKHHHRPAPRHHGGKGGHRR